MSLEPPAADPQPDSEFAAPSTAPAHVLAGADGRIVASTEVFNRLVGIDAIASPAVTSAIVAVTSGAQDLVAVLVETQGGQPFATRVEAVIDPTDRRQALIETFVERPPDDAETVPRWFATFAADSVAIVWLKDLTGRYVYVNRQYTAQLGVEADAVCGRDDRQLSQIEAIDGPRIRNAVRPGLGQSDSAAEPLQLEYTIPAFDRRPAYAALRFPVLDSASRPLLVCGVASRADQAELAAAECAHLLEVLQWFRGDAEEIRDDVMARWGLTAVRPQGLELGGEPEPEQSASVAELTEATARAEAAERASAELEDRIDVLQQQLVSEHGRALDLEASLADARGRADALAAALEVANTRMSSVDAAHTRIRELEAMVATVGSAGVAAAESARRVTELEAEARALSLALEQARHERESLMATEQAQRTGQGQIDERHRVELQALEERHRAELHQVHEQVHAQLQHARQQHDAELRAVREQLESDHAADLAARQTQHAADLAAHEIEHTAQQAARAAEHAAELTARDARHADDLDARDAHLTDALKTRDAEHDSAVAALRASRAAELDALRAQHERELADQVAEHEASLARLDARQREAADQAEHERESERRSLAERHRSELRDAEERRLADLRQQEAQLSTSSGGEEAHIAEIAFLKRVHQEELAAALDQQALDLVVGHDRAMAELRRSFEHEREAQEHHEHQLIHAEDRLRMELNAANQRHRSELDHLREKHAAELDKRTQGSDRARERSDLRIADLDRDLHQARLRIAELESALAASGEHITRLERAAAAATAAAAGPLHPLARPAALTPPSIPAPTGHAATPGLSGSAEPLPAQPAAELPPPGSVRSPSPLIPAATDQPRLIGDELPSDPLSTGSGFSSAEISGPGPAETSGLNPAEAFAPGGSFPSRTGAESAAPTAPAPSGGAPMAAAAGARQPGWSAAAQQALSDALRGCLNLRSILSESVRLIGTGGGWDAVVAWVPNEREAKFSCAATWVRSPVEMARLETSMWQLRQSPADSAIGATAGSAELFWVTEPDAYADRHLKLVASEGIDTVVLMPVLQQSQTVAVIEFCSESSTPRSPQADAALDSINREIAAATQRLTDSQTASQWGRRRR